MDIPEIDLAQYHQKAVEAIAAKFADSIDGAFAYHTFADTVPKSISIELDGIYPGEPADLGTEQFHGELRFSAYVVVPFTVENPKLIVRQLATRLIGFIRGNRFACPGAGAASIIGGDSDGFSLPGKTGRAGSTEEYEVWRVEWSLEAFIGENVWKDDGSVPVPVEVWTENNGEEMQVV